MSKNILYTLLIVASLAMYMIAIKPVYTGVGGVMQPEKSIQELRVLNTQYDDTLNQADGLVAQANKMRQQYEGITVEDKASMQVMVPDSIDKVRLLSEVEHVAQDAGFSITDLTYSEGGSSANGKGSVYISFSVKTTYSQFKVLMNNFEKSMRLFSINNVSFTTPAKEGELTTYQVKLETYYLK